MPLSADDSEYLKRLRGIEKDRGVKLLLDRDRLIDAAYIQGLRARHPLNSSDAQWRFASDISEATGRPLGLAEATNSFSCSRYIDENRKEFYEIAPSKAQRTYAYKVAQRYRVAVPRKVLLNREAYEQWIADFRKSDLAEVGDILDRLSWSTWKIQKVMADHGFASADGIWYRCMEFVSWLIERHGHVLRDPGAAHDAKCQEAKEMLRRGHDRYSVADSYGLSDRMVTEIASGIEADGDVIID